MNHSLQEHECARCIDLIRVHHGIEVHDSKRLCSGDVIRLCRGNGWHESSDSRTVNEEIDFDICDAFGERKDGFWRGYIDLERPDIWHLDIDWLLIDGNDSSLVPRDECVEESTSKARGCT